MLPVDAGRGAAAEWPIVTTSGFPRTGAAARFCSGCLVGLCSGCFTGDAAALGLCSGCLVGFCSGRFTGAVTALGFCSGWSTGTAAGKSGWCDVDVPISLGGRGGDISPNIGENSRSADAALKLSATRLITKIARIHRSLPDACTQRGPSLSASIEAGLGRARHGVGIGMSRTSHVNTSSRSQISASIGDVGEVLILSYTPTPVGPGPRLTQPLDRDRIRSLAFDCLCTRLLAFFAGDG